MFKDSVVSPLSVPPKNITYPPIPPMKISTRGRYGLRILMDLAQNDTETPRMISDICKSQNLSRKYIGRLIIPLCRAGLVVSRRGAKGGYLLNCDPKEVSLLEILEIMEGKVSVVSCVSCPQRCKRAKTCVARDIWVEINNKIRSVFESLTLQQILDHHLGQNDFCL